MSNGDPIWISIARTGVIVKRSRLGLMGTILLKESNALILGRIYEAINKQVLECKTPSNMTNPLLKVLTQAALDADSGSQLKIRLDDLSSGA